MHDIQKTALNRLLSVLGSLKAEYRINLPDGTTYGTLEIKAKEEPKPEKRSRNLVYRFGELSEYCRALIASMEVHDVLVLPSDVYPAKTLASSVSSTAARLWGPGSYMVARCGPDKATVQIMRTA